MNERTYYGNTGDLILTDVQYVDGIDETPSGTITCTFPGTLEGALAATPELGTSLEHLPESTREELGTTVRVRLVLKNRTFSAGKDGSVNVVLKYGFREEDASSSASQSTEYQVTGLERETSILLHPRYAAVPEREKLLAKALLDGTRLFDPVWRHKTKLMMSSTEPADPENWHEKETLEDAIKTVVQSDAGKLLIEKIRKGVTSYNAERLEWTETSYARSLSAAASGLSQIDTPPGDTPAISGDWRMTKAEANKTESERYWEIKKTWTASDAGSNWDKDLYAAG